ncbi:MAG: hypothetical protein O7H40_12905, partial [Gammaproteobacteria bacterium]|nr:hypothetical protein [Gammaproteobacteria bacterium]
MILIRFFKFAMIGVLLGAVLSPLSAQEQDASALLRERLESVQGDAETTIRGASVAAAPFLLRLYSRRNFEPAWNDVGRIDEFIGIIEATREEGLNPEDYHAKLLRDTQRRTTGSTGAQLAVDFDVLLTDALVRLGAHLRFGKVDPVGLDPNWNVARDLRTDDPVAVFQAAIDADSLKAFIDERIPRQAFYQRFKQALARYREIREAGGWPTIAEG